MKKSKTVLSLFSILLCASLMFGVFTSSAFKDTAAADVKLQGVSGKLYRFGEDILQAIYDKEDKSQVEKNHEKINEKVILGGFPVGLKLYADGVIVVGTEPVDTSTGDVNTAEKAGLLIGDVIKKVNGIKVTTNAEVSQHIEKSNGNELEFEIMRGKELLKVNFCAAFSVSEGKYKAGLWIRDSSAGIGTVTFCTQNGLFASLGHAVCDIDTKEVLPIAQGECTSVNLTGFIKGGSGVTGELCGILESDSLGVVYDNGDIGVYGEYNTLPEGNLIEIANSSEVKTGEASIFTTLENGAVTEYKIDIVSIDSDSKENKNLVLKVKDKNLINKSGGIIQGMSGSPIVQNGRLVGAVTHVFLDDPTGGYGIFAETMLAKLNSFQNSEEYKKAS